MISIFTTLGPTLGRDFSCIGAWGPLYNGTYKGLGALVYQALRALLPRPTALCYLGL